MADQPEPDQQRELDDLVRLLDLEQLDTDRFRGQSHQTRTQRVFGGQVAGQALVAAGRTVASDRHVHSLHGYFIRPGDPNEPIDYEVDRARDGRSFSVRRTVALQHGKAIFTLSASFQLQQDGIEHEARMPDVPHRRTCRRSPSATPTSPSCARNCWPVPTRSNAATSTRRRGSGRVRATDRSGCGSARTAHCPTIRCCTCAC